MIDLDKLETIGLMLPQSPATVFHHFGPGVYMREVIMQPGYVLGRSHREPVLNIMLSGRLSLVQGDGTLTECVAPMTFTSPPGRKLAIVHEPTSWLNVVATTETDVAKIEKAMFDDSEVSKQWDAAVLAFSGMWAKADREDFDAFVAESGWTAEQVRAMSVREDNQIPMPAPWSATLTVRESPIEGRGLFTSAPIAAGDVICPARLGGKRTPGGRFVNHAKVPNAQMVAVGNGDVNLVALRQIAGAHGGDDGEEITVDYRQAVEAGRQP